MATGFLSPIGMIMQLLTDQGVVGAGFKINTYVGGTVNTPQQTWTDSTLTVLNPNPIVMGSNGRFQSVSVWGPTGTLIKMVITDSLNNLIAGGTIDNIPLINDVPATNLFVRTAGEIAAGVTPVDTSYLPGDLRRYGGKGDGGTTDNTTALQNALSANAGFATVYVPNMGAYFKVTARVTAPANTHIRLEEGAELKWTATTATGTVFLGIATRPGIEVTGDNFLIEGKGKITGPATVAAGSGAGNGGVSAYVVNEVGLFRMGTSAANRGTGFKVSDVEISLWGSYGVLTQYVQDIQLLGNSIHDVGYTGVTHLSAQNSKEYYNKVYGIAPGTAGNAYGLSHNHDSTGYNTDPLVNATVTAITQAASAVVTISTVSVSNPYAVGMNITFFGISGMTQINGLSAVVSAIGGSSGAWTVTVPINSTGFSPFLASAVISGITTATNAVVTLSTVSTANPYVAGQAVTFAGVNGMTQINGVIALILSTGGVSGAWTLTMQLDTSSGFSAYTSAGTTNSGPVIGCPRQAANPFCIDMDCAFNEIRDVPSWIGLDAHGCYEGRYHHNSVYNCFRGIQIATGSGAASNYAGENNRVEDNCVISGQINGNATTVATGYQHGIGLNGGSLVTLNGQHRGVVASRNQLVGMGHANASPSVYCMEASYVTGLQLNDNTFRACVGYGVYMVNSSGQIKGNEFDSVGASSTASTCLYISSNCGPLTIANNKHYPVTGSLTAYSIGLNAPGTLANYPRITAMGNDFSRCTTPYSSFNGSFTKGNSDFTPVISDSTTGSHTLDVSVCGLAPRIVIFASQGIAATLTSLLNPQATGQEATILMTGAGTLTVNDSGNIRLQGGTAAVTNQSSLTLVWVASAGLWFERSRALGNT